MTPQTEQRVMDGYLHVVIDIPRLSVVDMGKLVDQIAVSCARHNFKKVLLENRAPEISGLSTTEMYTVGEHIGSTLVGYRVAYVVQRVLNKETEFAEIVAINRGCNVRFFNDMDQALNWLNT